MPRAGQMIELRGEVSGSTFAGQAETAAAKAVATAEDGAKLASAEAQVAVLQVRYAAQQPDGRYFGEL